MTKLFLGLVCLCFSTMLFAADTLSVAVASNFLSMTKTLVELHEKQFPEEKIRLSSASTAKLTAQIMHGAPYDVFLAADEQSIQHLVKKGLVEEGDTFVYGKGQLVLWSNRDIYHTRDDFVQAFQRGDWHRLVLANPKLAPYGRAAWQVILKLQVPEEKLANLVYAENINQAFQFVVSQNVDMGLVALSQVIRTQKSNAYWQVPESWYSPIVQSGAILKSASRRLAARHFVDRLLSAEIQDGLMREWGYRSTAEFSKQVR